MRGDGKKLKEMTSFLRMIIENTPSGDAIDVGYHYSSDVFKLIVE